MGFFDQVGQVIMNPEGALNAVGQGVGAITGTNKAQDAAERAAEQQSQAAAAGMSETRRQFDKLVELMSPYVAAGTGGLRGMQDIIGINGLESQQKSINDIQNSPIFAGLLKQGENAMMQNAAATGGLRGGNFQGALANFRPTLLNQLLEQQYARLGGLTSLGQNAAAMQGNAGIQTGSNIANLLGQQGAAQAGGTMAGGMAGVQNFNNLMQLGGMATGAGWNPFGSKLPSTAGQGMSGGLSAANVNKTFGLG